MNARGFSIEGSLGYGWSTFRANMGFFIPLALITFGVLAVAAIIVGVIAGATKGAGASAQILLQVVQILVLMGWINITLKYTRGESAVYGELFQPMSQFISFLITYVVYGVAVAVGFVLLIVPGIILHLRLQFAPYFLLDQKCGPIEALQKSWNATRGSAWSLFGLAVAIWFVNVLGLICLFVGLLATGPTSALAMADVYTKLRDSAEPLPQAGV